MTLNLTNSFNITDDASLRLDLPQSLATATVGGIHYLFAAGAIDNGVSVFRVESDGSLTSVANVGDDATLNLRAASSIAVAEVGGSTYLFVAGTFDDGVSVFSVGTDGSLTNVANVSDDATLELDGASSAATAVVGGTTYLFTVGLFDDGVSVFSVGADGSLTNVGNVTDDATTELDGTRAVATAEVGGVTYLFAAGGADSGVSAFLVEADGSLVNVDNVADDLALNLQGAFGLATAVVGGVTYLFVTSPFNDGVSVFAVAADGTLTNVDNVSDDTTLELDGASSVAAIEIGGVTYLFVAGVTDNGFSVFEVESDGSLTSVDNITDDATLELEGGNINLPLAAATFGATAYLFAAGGVDDGVSVFELASSGNAAPTDIMLSNMTIAENSAIGTLVGALSTTDPDTGDSFTYQLLDDAGGRFALNGNLLEVAGVLDFETATSHEVTVRVTDSGGLSHDETFTIGVTDVAEAGGVPVGTTGPDALIGTAAADTLDGLGGNDLIVGLGDDDVLDGGDGDDTILGGDGDDTLTGGAGDDQLYGDSGVDTAVFSGSEFDYAFTALGNGVYQISDLRAGAPDGIDTLYGIENITVAEGTFSLVGNVDPIDIALSHDTIAENSAVGALVGVLSATDPDPGDTFTYQLLNDAGGRFALNGNLLEVAGSLDFETATSHQVTVRVTDSGGLSHDETFTIGVADVAESAPTASSSGLDIINRDNVTDDATLPLAGPGAVATAEISGVSYLFVAGTLDQGISVFSLAADGTITAVASVADDATLHLAAVQSLATATVGGVTYLVAAGTADSGLSVFRVGADGSLANVFNIADDATLNLNFVTTVAVAEIAGVSYVFAGSFFGGVSVFAIGGDGSLTNVDNVSDDATLRIGGTASVTTAVVGGVPYLFAGGQFDDGISVFEIGADGSLSTVANVADNPSLELNGVAGLTTVVVDGTTYLFAAGALDDGVSVFRVGTDGRLTNVANVDDDATLNLDGASSVTTAVVGGTTYLFVGGVFDSGVSVFAVDADGALTHAANIADDATLQLGQVSGLTAATTFGSTYLLAASAGDDGVSVFELASDDTLIGTDGADVLDGLGGSDLIIGLDGDDTLSGGQGDDRLLGGNGTDTAVYSGNRSDYRVTDLGNCAFEVSDQRAGAPDGTDRLDGVENAVFADGAINLVAGRLEGGDGDDLLQGGVGNDTLTGRAGNDFIDGGEGIDTLIGGTGNDRFFVDDARDMTVETPDEGYDVVFSTVDYMLSDHIEILSLAVGNAVIGTGNAQSNTIFGNAGDNVLDGGGSSDALSGLGGNDTFVFHAGQASGDVVYEFDGNGAGAGDVLQFQGYGTLAQGATFQQVTATEWFITSADGLIQEVITLVGAPTVDASDFVFL